MKPGFQLMILFVLVALLAVLGCIVAQRAAAPDKEPLAAEEYVYPPREDAETTKELAYFEPVPETEPLRKPVPEQRYFAEAVQMAADMAEFDRLAEQAGSVEEAGEPGAEEAAEQSPEINPDELDMLACAIYQEAGSDYISDETRYMVGDVILNRVADPRYPDTMEGVLTQRGQYGRFYWTGIRWAEKAADPAEAAAVQRAYDTARELLSDTRHSQLYGAGYIYQAEFAQGRDVICRDGIHFGW